MNELKSKLNIILLTTLIHLTVILGLMFRKLSVGDLTETAITYIDLEFLKEQSEELEKEIEESKSAEDIDIDRYIASLRNVGTTSVTQNNSQQPASGTAGTMSEQDLKEMYEGELLKEKYGDNYQTATNRDYRDYLKENQNNNPTSKQSNNKTGDQSQNQVTHSGPALVFVDLENKQRGTAFLYVPVYTCKKGGKVVINITIDNNGKVKTATLSSVKSNGNDSDCIVEAAKSAAFQTKFTASTTGTEKGKIIYTFLDQ